MNERLEFSLFENAVDSLNEALKNYQECGTDNKHYKYTILNLTHFLELFLKYSIWKIEPLLLYREHFKNVTDSSQTINLKEALQVLRNLKKSIPNNLSQEISEISKIRNQIMHYKFSLDINRIKELIGRIMLACYEFNKGNQVANLEQVVHDSNADVFLDLAFDYEEKLRLAEKAVQEAKEKSILEANIQHDHSLIIETHKCEECDHETMIPDTRSPTGYICTFCKNTQTEEELVQCSLCGCAEPKSWMTCLESGSYACSCCLRT